MYKPVAYEDLIEKGEGRIAVVTGWTPVDAVVNELHEGQTLFGCIGTLYSSDRGIEILFVNLLANPQIEHILCLSSTKNDENSGSVQTLLNIMSGYSSAESILKISDVLTQDHVDLIRDTVSISEASSLKLLPMQLKMHEDLHGQSEVYRQPIILDYAIKTTDVIAGRPAGYAFRGSFKRAWADLIRSCCLYGDRIESAYGDTIEISSAVIVITDTFDQMMEMAPEFGLPDEFLQVYLKQYLNKTQENPEVEDSYTYADRLYRKFGDSVRHVVTQCALGFVSRRWYVNLWHSPIDRELKHPPCMVGIQFSMTGNKLSCMAHFRSSEISGALPANLIGIRKLQTDMVEEIRLERPNIEIGFLTANLGSAHINATSVKDAKHMSEEFLKQKSDFIDPTGRYIIKTTGTQVGVHWWSNKNNLIKEYSGWTYRGDKLLPKILKDNPAIDIEHLCYLSSELFRACKLEDGYSQL